MGDSLPTIDLGTSRTVNAIALGFLHTCALLDNKQLKCWGRNNYGQLGSGSTASQGDAADEMGDKLAAADLGAGRHATHIAAGVYHTCASLDNSQLKCWGQNINGQLGYGDKNTRGAGSGEMGDNLPAISLGEGASVEHMATGGECTCAVIDNGDLKCWGLNNYGQLGRRGDTSNIGDGVNEMGANLEAIYNMAPPTTTTATITTTTGATTDTTTATGTTTATTTFNITSIWAEIDAAVAGHSGLATLVALGAVAAVALQF